MTRALPGVWDAVLNSPVLLNLPFGPWGGGAWFRKLAEGAVDFVQVADEGDPVLLLAWQRFARDAILDPNSESDFKEFVQGFHQRDIFRRRGTRVVLSRWFSWVRAAAEALPQRHELFAVLLYLGIRLGYVSDRSAVWPGGGGPLASSAGGTAGGLEDDDDAVGLDAAGSGVGDGSKAVAACPQPAAVAACPQPAAVAACPPPAAASHSPHWLRRLAPQPQGPREDEKEAVAGGASDKKVDDLRRKCKNTLHAALHLAADEDMWFKMAVIVSGVGPVCTAHGKNAHRCRSPESVREWYSSMACVCVWGGGGGGGGPKPNK